GTAPRSAVARKISAGVSHSGYTTGDACSWACETAERAENAELVFQMESTREICGLRELCGSTSARIQPGVGMSSRARGRCDGADPRCYTRLGPPTRLRRIMSPPE